MKKTIFAFGLFVLLAGCGGGGGDDPVVSSIQVTLSGGSFGGGQGQSGRSLNVAGGGVNYTCHQSPTVSTPNNPNCQLAAAGTGNTDTPLIFNNLPAENQTYTFTEVSALGTGTADGNCQVTIENSTTLSFPTGNPCTLGVNTSNQLTLAFSFP